jgi:peptide/nickel transport system permease protein
MTISARPPDRAGAEPSPALVPSPAEEDSAPHGYEGLFARAWRQYRHNVPALAGTLVLAILGLAALMAPLMAPIEPNHIDLLHRFAAPGVAGHALGTDDLGRDTLSRLLYAGQISLTVGTLTGVLTVAIGALLGTVAGATGGRLDEAIMRFTDIMLSFPTLVLLLILAVFLGSTQWTIILIISVTGWMNVTRLVRGEVLSWRERDFIEAALALGASRAWIVWRHLLPNVMGIILVSATINMANAVLLESALSFLGLGIQPPQASWGTMLYNAQSYLLSAPWLSIFPGLAIVLSVMSFNLIGDGLRDAVDPRLVS